MFEVRNSLQARAERDSLIDRLPFPQTPQLPVAESTYPAHPRSQMLSIVTAG
jgi:hypothetical protein